MVFCAIKIPEIITPSEKKLDLERVIENAMTESQKEMARRGVVFKIRHPRVPRAKEASSRLRELPSVSLVIVYRTIKNTWDGPFKYISIVAKHLTFNYMKDVRYFDP